MTGSGDEGESEPDAEGSRAVALLRRGLEWLRDLHRGYAYTGHLPRRK